jgi:nucleoside-diphosphate-sugar epimerase
VSVLSKTLGGQTVLVTGGAGAIGTNLVVTLNELGASRIVILDNLSSAYEWNIPKGPRIRFVRGDVLDDETLTTVFKDRPDVVYHLAAHFANQNSVDHPELDLMVNGMGILKVLEHARKSDVERFVYGSSGCGIYGTDTPIPFTEEYVSMDLYTPYQVTKMLGELYTNMYHNLYALPIVNARFFNSYGPGEVPGKYRNVIPNFFYWAMNGQPLPITGTGKETRDFTYVGDIVSGLIACGSSEKAIGEPVNLATGRETRILDLATWVNELVGNEAGIVFKERRNWDTKSRLLASIEKAKKTLGYVPRTDIRAGLKEVHSWFEKNWDNIRKSAEF